MLEVARAGVVFGRASLVVAGIAIASLGCHRAAGGDGAEGGAPARAVTSTSTSTAGDATELTSGGAAHILAVQPRTRPAVLHTDAVFSAPIAAVRVGKSTVVAGLVVTAGVIRVIGWPDDGPPWSADVLSGVAWTPDAELGLDPAGDDIAVVWRGNVGGKPSHTLAVLGSRGERRGDPVAVGGSFCATATGIAWVDATPHGPSHVRARGPSEIGAHDVLTLPMGHAASVLCGDHDVFALGDGDDDLTATAFVPEDRQAPAPAVILRDSDFGDDEERDHRAYVFGDTLGIVRVSSSGAVALREVTRAGPGPWHRLKHKVGADDDVVASDGDATSVTVVFTRDVEDACGGGSTTESVRAIRFDRATGQDFVVDLARPDCHVARGPFWLTDSNGPAVAWVERAQGGTAGGAPIAALALGAVAGDAGSSGRVPVAADALVQGASNGACWFAALLRAPDADGSQAEAIAVVPYP